MKHRRPLAGDASHEGLLKRKADTSRVCVKALPAFGRRRLHRNTDFVDCPALGPAKLGLGQLGLAPPPHHTGGVSDDCVLSGSHEQQSVAVALTAALHHSTGPNKKKVVRRERQEEDVHETARCPRGPKTPSTLPHHWCALSFLLQQQLAPVVAEEEEAQVEVDVRESGHLSNPVGKTFCLRALKQDRLEPF